MSTLTDMPLSDEISEASAGVTQSDEEEEIMKLLDMDGLPGEITENLPEGMTETNETSQEVIENDENTQEYEGTEFYKEKNGEDDDQAGDESEAGDSMTGKNQQIESSSNEEVKEEKAEADMKDTAQHEPADSSTDPNGQLKTETDSKELKTEPMDSSESTEGEGRQVIKVLMKKEVDPLEALQIHLQKTQEDMEKLQQQDQQSKGAQAQPPQPQAVTPNQAVPQVKIKQEPGVAPQNNQQQQQQQQHQQQFRQQQQHQQQLQSQQQQQQQQFRMQQQQQRMPHPQQQSPYKQVAQNIRPPPPLQDMRSQIQQFSGSGSHDGPVQCEICHRTFLTERGYLSHRHVHTEATGPPRPKLLKALNAITCKTCLARAKFRQACAMGKADPGKVDFSAPCVECGSKTIPSLPTNDALAMRQVYNRGGGGRPPGPFIVPGTVRSVQQQQMQQRANLHQQRMAHQAQRFAGMYRQPTSFSQNHSNRNQQKSMKDDDDIKIVSVTPGRHSHKSPAKSQMLSRQHQQGQLRSPSQSPAKRKYPSDSENGVSPSTTPTKSTRNTDNSSTSSSSSSVSTPEVTSSASSLGQQDDQNTDGLLDILVQQKKIYECTHCKILFREFSLYAVHIGMHSSDNPMTCSMCGKACTSKFEFLCHHNNN